MGEGGGTHTPTAALEATVNSLNLSKQHPPPPPYMRNKNGRCQKSSLNLKGIGGKWTRVWWKVPALEKKKRGEEKQRKLERGHGEMLTH